jgi:hypothetical protein
MSSTLEKNRAEVAYLTGRTWLDRNYGKIAAAQFEKALSLRPEHPEAHRYLAYALILQGEFATASAHLDHAADTHPEDEDLRREARLLRELADLPPPVIDLPDNPGGRLRFANRYERIHHRSGWRYAMEALYPLHHSEGVLFEGFLEEPFAWQHPRPGIRPFAELLFGLRSQFLEFCLSSEERRIVPYREPWVGFLHNPHNMPLNFHAEESPQTIFAKPIWQESLKTCIGLFALSEYAAEWLRKTTGKPVSVLTHPTEIPPLLFDFQRFEANPHKQIVQVGWWLRRLTAIDRLPLAQGNALGYSKLRLVPSFCPGAADYLTKLRKAEFGELGLPTSEYSANTFEREHIPNDEYDRLLAENIVFIDLYDASANNAVIECLARTTPILVNRLSAVEEYLGRDYPLYYQDYADAAAKALDLGRLRAAHDYLGACETRQKLGSDYFRQSLEASEVYQSL